MGASTAVVRKREVRWAIALPEALPNGLQWEDGARLFVHPEPGDGLWLSASDETATFQELAALAAETIEVTAHARAAVDDALISSPPPARATP